MRGQFEDGKKSEKYGMWSVSGPLNTTVSQRQTHITTILYPGLDPKTFDVGSLTQNTDVRRRAILYHLGNENRFLHARITKFKNFPCFLTVVHVFIFQFHFGEVHLVHVQMGEGGRRGRQACHGEGSLHV